MKQQLGRSVPRQPVDWRGWYAIEADTEHDWRQCRVVDVAASGAGVELDETAFDEPWGRRIIVAVGMRGFVRNVTPRGVDSVRVGIEFDEVTSAAQEFVSLMKRLRRNW